MAVPNLRDRFTAWETGHGSGSNPAHLLCTAYNCCGPGDSGIDVSMISKRVTTLNVELVWN